MEITHIEHIGIAVKSIEEQLPYYEGILGLKCYNIETVEDQKVKTAFFMVGQTKLELLEPTSERVPLPSSSKKRRRIHHIAYATKNLGESLKEMESKGCV